MRAVDLIEKKRDQQQLTGEEIRFLIGGFNRGEIPDYQAAAWSMAVLLNGMSAEETTELTLAMADSGERLDLSDVVGIAVDKHSTGGVGDKTSLIVCPTVAACGLPVGKMSGRGLGFSGGTLDKLESIPGYRCGLSTEEFMSQLRSIGIVLTGQSADLAPADGKLYALRDVTGTVPSIPLIASSVMSKKLAAGAQAMVLDVKLGVGAFMKNEQQARQLAVRMVEIARLAGRQAVALLSDMNQPLGCAIGNAVEVREAIDCLQNRGPSDLREHCLEVSAHMLVLGGKAGDLASARDLAADCLEDGRAWQKFRQLVLAQGGDVSVIEEPERLPQAPYEKAVPASRSGWLAEVHAGSIGEAVVLLGGGRARKGDSIDHAVGIRIAHKVGDRVEAGEPLFTVLASDRQKLDQAIEAVSAAHRIAAQPVSPLPLFYGVVR